MSTTLPETLTELEILTSVDVAPYEDSDDPNRRTHIVNPPNNLHIWEIGMSAQDIVNIARMTGMHVVALCGYTWIPKHNPDKYDACDTCIRIAGDLMRGNGE